MNDFWLPPGVERPDKPGSPAEAVPMPVGDLTLSDGRVLRYKGQQKLTVDLPGPDGSTKQTMVQHYWVCTKDGLGIVASMDNAAPHGEYLHISMSYRTHLPDWETIKMVKDAYYGDVDCCMILPRKADYVNVHKYTMHVWQLPVHWGIQ